MTAKLRGGSLGGSVWMARYRQHVLLAAVAMLAVLALMQPAVAGGAQEAEMQGGIPMGDGPPHDAAWWSAVTYGAIGVLLVLAIMQYWLDGYAIKYLRLREVKLVSFGKRD